jgi:hypothetical protein
MTDERDPKLQSAYRALGNEEPPRALDEAILAASRRTGQLHPAPLVAPTGRRSWSVPLAAAAVLALAVGVTLHMQLEQPGIDGLPTAAERARPEAAAKSDRSASPAPDFIAYSKRSKEENKMKSGSVPRTLAPETDTKPAEKAAASLAELERQVAETSKRQQRLESTTARDSSDPEAAGAARVAEMRAGKIEASSAESVAGAVARSPAPTRSALSEARAPAPQASQPPAMALAKRADAPAKDAADTPERELERIAGLRKEQKHDEADKALAEFRKRYPDFKIPVPMLERVERR